MLIMLLKFAGLKNKTQIFRNFFEAVKLCLLTAYHKTFTSAYRIVTLSLSKGEMINAIS